MNANGTVLSVHHTSQGIVRYRRFNDQITVEILVPPDPVAPEKAAAWQLHAVAPAPSR
jgi:hypothetical protein